MEFSENKDVISPTERSKSEWKFEQAYSGTGNSSKGKQRFAYNTGREISEGLHSWLSTGGTELRLKEPED